MFYYKVKAEYDKVRVYRKRNNQRLFISSLVAHELKTAIEYKNLMTLSDSDISHCFDIVYVNKNTAYLQQGVRFAS